MRPNHTTIRRPPAPAAALGPYHRAAPMRLTAGNILTSRSIERKQKQVASSVKPKGTAVRRPPAAIEQPKGTSS